MVNEQKQSPLEQELKNLIRTDGPLPIERYMALALGHPQHGYYMSRDPFGREGDFITAPEVSQIFGELIGIWCVAGWQMMNAPDPVHLIELGPGRGTLMADALRAADVMPGFTESVQVHMVETSPALKAMQQNKLKSAAAKVTWHDHLSDIPDGPSLIIANEFFDALPVQQIQRRGDSWHERVIGLDDQGDLQIGLAREQFLNALVPVWAADAPDGAIAELAPQRELYALEIGNRIKSHGGGALIIDYGHVKSAPGDTLQAIQKHRSIDVLAQPGMCDLTSHVDFANLEAALKRAGVNTHGPLTQSQFLLGMGLKEREDALKRRGDARQRILISRATQRLAAGAQMGHLFKVIAATDETMAVPAPFAGQAAT